MQHLTFVYLHLSRQITDKLLWNWLVTDILVFLISLRKKLFIVITNNRNIKIEELATIFLSKKKNIFLILQNFSFFYLLPPQKLDITNCSLYRQIFVQVVKKARLICLREEECQNGTTKITSILAIGTC